MNNKIVYEKKYSNGYGIRYPESHIIRIYEHFLKEIFADGKEKKMLDFGCGNGIHSKFFEEKGFRTVGIDISENAINVAKMTQSTNNEYIQMDLIKEDSQLIKGYDLILANQSLYYLSINDIKTLMGKFNHLLTEDGLVVFTMMSKNNYYFRHAIPIGNGQYKVSLNGRLNEETVISFIEDEKHLVQVMDEFVPLHTGKYDFTMKEGSSEHFYFIGKKAK